MGAAIWLIGAIFIIRHIANTTNVEHTVFIFIRDRFLKALPPQHHVGAICTRASIQGEISDLRSLCTCRFQWTQE